MGLFKKKNTSEMQELNTDSYSPKEDSMVYIRYCADNLLKKMDTYMEQEVDITHCVDSVQKRSEKSLEELSTIEKTIAEISENYNVFTQSAGQINESMDHSEETINEANNSMDNLTMQIDNSKHQLQGMTQTFGQLESDFEKITELTRSITGISSRTNLLALNASIEAARAGEAGRGFAVVAEQIRELSSSTAELVQGIVESIKTLYGSLENLQQDIGKTADLIHNNIEYANNVKADLNQVKECTYQVKGESDRIVNEINGMRTEIDEAVKDVTYTRTAIGNIQEEINDLNRKSELKSVSLCEVLDMLHQMSNIANE